MRLHPLVRICGFRPQLEHQLEGAERTLSGLGTLDAQQADRVAQRMDRLASQLLEISAPPPIDAVHQRLGIAPVGPDELQSLADQMVLATAKAEGGEASAPRRPL